MVSSMVLLGTVRFGMAQTGTVVRAEASTSQPNVGEILTVEIVISNVQNLYAVDVTFNWNPSVLQVISATSLLGVESNPGGVLHESASDPLYVVEDNASQALGEYDLVATSVAPAPAFSGSGTIATLKFNVMSMGSAGLALKTDLSNYNPAGATLIAHTDTADSVTATATVPEFPTWMILPLFALAILLSIAFIRKRIPKK